MKKIDRGIFGIRLKECREKLGLSQSEVATLINIANSSYSAYETGKQNPKINVLSRICKELDVSSDWLLGLKEWR